jgi:hypothetical protein
LSLLLAGVAVILLGFDLRQEYLMPVQAIVALMLTGLGARALWVLWRETKNISGAERPGVVNHAHRHHNHPYHNWWRLGIRPMMIGMIHGLAGSAALLLLMIPVIPSTALKLVYILVFGAGSIAGMIVMSWLVGLPGHLTATRFLRLNLAVRALAGLFSLGFGSWLLHEFVESVFQTLSDG